MALPGPIGLHYDRGVLEIAFRPDRGREVPIARQLADHLAELVRTGRLPAGRKLPAAREAAAALALGRKTVATAYEVLATRGLVTAHVGRGTFVAAGSRTAAPIAAVGAHAPARPSPRAFAWPGLFARSASRTLPTVLRLLTSGGPAPFDFRGGRIDASMLPAAELRWAFGRPFRTRSRLAESADHMDPFGWPPLRREIARHLASRGIACDPSEVAVVNGLQQAIALTAHVLVEPGDAVAMEQPGYFGAALAFTGAGADLLGVDVDREGMEVEKLARVLRVRRVKLVYVTPATQSPTGVAMSPARRDALLALADEYQVPVFEDDYDCELRYSGPVLPALKAADPAGQVVHAGTFSKILFPSLRVGYVVAARPLLERMVLARAVSDLGSGVVEQVALATLLATRGLERHLRRMRRHYAQRLDALLAALAREMPEGTAWTEPRSGHLVWLTLPRGVDPDRLQEAARRRGVAYGRGEIFHFDERGGENIALAFTAIDPDAIAEGVRQLGAAIRENLARSRRAEGGSRRRRSPVARANLRRRGGRSVDAAR
jgi:GntR family transcriptional regulator / MocR family aminotransferase